MVLAQAVLPRSMVSLFSHWICDESVGSLSAVVLLVAGCLVCRHLWKHRDQRRRYAERTRQRRSYWGWE